MSVDFKKIEMRWQKAWEEKKLFITSNQKNKPKYSNFDSAPSPNGELHLGHARNYVLGDIMARYKRSCGFDVLYSTNFDSFGLPNQLEAEKCRKSPKDFTSKCILSIKRDLKNLGISYDWSRVNSTSDPKYYKWTQWLFLELHSAGLVYRKNSDVNWCNNCKTVLAHMEINNGHCERCNNIIEQKQMPQWFIALTEYSDELYSSIGNLNGWSDRAINLLKGFMGKTSGTLVPFRILGSDKILDVFLPNNHSLEDVTFVGTAASWSGIKDICQLNDINFDALIHDSQLNLNISRKRTDSTYACRTGLDSGIKLEHPSLSVPIPLLIVNYLSDKEGPPVKAGVPASNNADRILANNLSLPKTNKQKLLQKVNFIKSKKISYYYIHDWMVSRQKKWGTQLPFIECQHCGFFPVQTSNLPVTNGQEHKIMCPKCSKEAKYVTDTLDCYLDDAWCFLSTELATKDNFTLESAGKYGWFPTDHYHAGYDIYMYLHLYRFIALFLFKRGHLNTPEPIRIHYGHDMVLQDNKKMSTHHHNTCSLSSLLDEHGADVIRISILLTANPNKPIIWNDEHLLRAKKYLSRILKTANLFTKLNPGRLDNSGYHLSTTIKKSLKNKNNRLNKSVTKYIEAYRPATCIQYLEQHAIELYNVVKLFKGNNIQADDYYLVKGYILTYCILSSPFSPHIAEEVWEIIGGEKMVSQSKWPH